MRTLSLDRFRRNAGRRAREVDALTLPPLFNWEAELRQAPSQPQPGGWETHWWEIDESPWYRTDYGRWRAAAEVTAMRRFPGFEASLSTEGLLVWTGWLTSGLGVGRRYLVRVTYPWDFPDEAPEVAIVRPQLPEEVPHLLSGQRPCLYRGGSEDGFDPGSTTAATLVAWTALWIHAFETWRATGVWPGAAV